MQPSQSDEKSSLVSSTSKDVEEEEEESESDPTDTVTDTVDNREEDKNEGNQEQDDDEDESSMTEEEQSLSTTTPVVIEQSPKGRFQRFNDELGRGAYKIVYKGVDLETGREIAWNVINLRRLPKQDRPRIRQEIDLIKQLKHKNIIHFISAWQKADKEQVIFITEMITGGSLRSYVKKIKHPRLKVIK